MTTTTIGEAVLHGGGEFLPVHQEIAVAGEADDDAVGIQLLGGDRRRQAEAHRAAGRPELLLEPAKAQEAADPDREIAGAGGEDRVGDAAAQREHDLAQLHRARASPAPARSRRDSRRAPRASPSLQGIEVGGCTPSSAAAKAGEVATMPSVG